MSTFDLRLYFLSFLFQLNISISMPSSEVHTGCKLTQPTVGPNPMLTQRTRSRLSRKWRYTQQKKCSSYTWNPSPSGPKCKQIGFKVSSRIRVNSRLTKPINKILYQRMLASTVLFQTLKFRPRDKKEIQDFYFKGNYDERLFHCM